MNPKGDGMRITRIRKYYSSSLRRYYPDQVSEKSVASFNGYNLSLSFSLPFVPGSKAPLEL